MSLSHSHNLSVPSSAFGYPPLHPLWTSYLNVALKAAEVKAKIDARTRERVELEGVLDRSGSDVEKMEAALRDVANSSAKKQQGIYSVMS